MKVNFDFVLSDLQGQPIKDGEAELKLGTVVASVMLAVVPNEDQNIAANDKVRMFKLAQLAVNGGEQDVSAEDIAIIKKRVNKMYGALIVGRVFEAVEG